MRKIFTLLFLAVAAVAARATDYNVPITVTVNNGATSEQTGVISVVENGGLYELTVKNFILQSGEDLMPVGNVELKGIKPYQDGNATLLLTKQTVTITEGDDPNMPFWLATSLPPVPVDLRGKIVNGTLRCYLDINLEVLKQVIQVAIGDDKGYQMPNPSFEDWHTSDGSYVEPNSWHSFESATGNLVSLAGHHIEKSDDAHSGDACARIFSTEVNAVFFKIIANGTMTTGRMNAGSASAADARGNYAYLDMNMKDDNNEIPTDGNGDPFYTPLCSRPDAVSVWVKFKQGKANSQHPNATISAVITDGTFYQDPENPDNIPYTNVVAKAKNNTIATTGGQWKQIVIPFTTEYNVDPKAVLITVSTNADPGQGSDGDEVLVDDIEFIYNAKVTGLKVKGQAVTGFSAEQAEYEMELNEAITADDIEVAVEGTPHVVKNVEEKDGEYICTIDVIGSDMKAKSSYVVKVKSSATGIRSIQPAANQSATYFTLDGRQVSTLVPGNVYISRQADGTVKKIRP
jgi:hypothetical protein